jgi:hypothetical protein
MPFRAILLKKKKGDPPGPSRPSFSKTLHCPFVSYISLHIQARTPQFTIYLESIFYMYKETFSLSKANQ